MGDERKAKVRERFGASADAYAKSEIHARGESLALLVELVKPQKGWRALDVATGAGHTALATAPRVTRVIATDMTREMLVTAARLARERGITNMEMATTDAESLPFKDSSFDLVTCRLGFHHFSNPRRAIREFARVLKPGAILGFDDNFVIEGGKIAEDYNAFEKVRDPSHQWAFTFAELQSMLEDAGLQVQTSRRLPKELEFREWTTMQHVSGPDKEKLLDMLKHMPPPLQKMLRPRHADGTVYFSLWEAVIIAKKMA